MPLKLYICLIINDNEPKVIYSKVLQAPSFTAILTNMQRTQATSVESRTTMKDTIFSKIIDQAAMEQAVHKVAYLYRINFQHNGLESEFSPPVEKRFELDVKHISKVIRCKKTAENITKELQPLNAKEELDDTEKINIEHLAKYLEENNRLLEESKNKILQTIQDGSCLQSLMTKYKVRELDKKLEKLAAIENAASIQPKL